MTLIAAALSLAMAACTNDTDSTSTAEGSTAAMQADPAAAPAAATQPSTPDAAAAGPAGTLADGDRKALLAVEEVDRHEIAAAEDALGKNVQGQVRAYAETLRDEHGRNLEATLSLLGGAGAAMGAGAHDAMGNPAHAGAGTSPAMDGQAGSTADVAAAGPRVGSDVGPGSAATPELAAMKEKHEAERSRLAALKGEEFSREWVAAMVKGHEEALAKLDNELIPGATDPAVTAHLQSTRSAISRHLDTARSLQQAP
ncbi:DUF4142 domain-containing protein [Luteimonas sp. SDU101]|uniref:DUF4142 domain-containing protein n=1 Tax=Luteimonas sp. SDU101 TaxID=3422593 RepID=UPI003EB8A81F